MVEQHPPNTIPNHIEEPPPLIEIEGDLELRLPKSSTRKLIATSAANSCT